MSDKKLIIPKIQLANPFKNREKENRLALIKLTFLFAAIVVCTLFVTFIIIYLVVFKTSLIKLVYSDKAIIAAIILICFVIGYTIAFAVGRLLINPIKNIINCFDSLSHGEYETRLKLKGPLAKYKAFEDFSKSFNSMAEELQHTELLNNDFINNFSHEFKTPIVSISGFAKLLKKPNISEEQKIEYINIIEEESLRLASITTNILNLVKVENQEILTAITKFNLSEQIRNSILVLSNKWNDKNFDFQLDFNEYYIWANEELLKQVWLNLLDNAIKFTPVNGIIRISISQEAYYYVIELSNSGSFIPEEARERIFNKFYQADESHSSSGNGIGLAVVKKIITLHQGKISVDCKDNFTTFKILLPF